MFPFNINISVFNVYGNNDEFVYHIQKSCIPVYQYDIFGQTLKYFYRLSQIILYWQKTKFFCTFTEHSKNEY